jgi:hypothetical protein
MKRRKPGKKSNATKLAHKKFRWQQQLRAEPKMTLLGMRICLEISDRSNLDYNGAVIIAQDTWAEKYGVRRESLNRTLRRIVALGHLQSIRRGRDRPNAYRMVLKEQVQTTFDFGKSPTSEASDDATSSVTSSPSRCDVFIPDDVTSSVTRDPLSLPGLPSEAPGRKREKDALTRINSSPGGVPPARQGAGPPAKKIPLHQHRARGPNPPSRDLGLWPE